MTDPTLRILVLNPYGRPDTYSGPSVLLDRLFQSLVDCGARATVLSVGARYSWARSASTTAVRHVDGPLSQLIWAVESAFFVARERRRCDLVHLHGCYFFGLLPALVALALRLDYVVFPLLEGGDLSGESTRAIPGASSLRKFILSRARMGFALSDGLAKELELNGLPASKVRRLSNIVDGSFFESPASIGRRDTAVVGLVGVLGERKGVLDVVRAISLLSGSSGLKVKGLFVGPFESLAFEQLFWAKVDSLGLRNVVTVTGYVPRVKPYLDEMSVFTLPSHGEGMPGALCEAMASGLPFVVSDVGAMGEIAERSGAGLVVGAGDATGLSRAIRELLAAPEEWCTASERARNFALKEFMGRSVAQHYLHALSMLGRPADSVSP